VGETRVDLQHLLEDLRDAYSGSLEETILTEIVANALDSGAATIRLTASPSDCALTVVDDGHGMQRRELPGTTTSPPPRRLGAGNRIRGVGIKLGLLISREVLTGRDAAPPRRHGGTWPRAIAHRGSGSLLWPGPERGTASASPLLDPLSAQRSGFIEEQSAAISSRWSIRLRFILGRHYRAASAWRSPGRRLSRPARSAERCR
jgi:hypothetical protein